MSSTITALTSGGGLAMAGDTSGQLELKTNNGTTAVTINTSQQVLVGTTTTPSSSAQGIVNVNSGGGFIQLGFNNSNGGGSIGAISGGGLGFYGYTGTVGSESYSERMRIGSNGYVAIGTASPSNEAMLHIKATSSAFPQLQLVQDNATDGWNLNATSAGGWLAFQRKGSGGTNTVAYYDPSGNLVISGSTAQKASGTTWSNPSDVRLKQNITDYTKGLAELTQVNVKSWDYNGKAGTTAGSKGLGVIADEIMQVLPETVDTYEAKLNAEDEEVTDVKRFDATEITWLLVNAVKELNAKVDAQALEIQALKGVA